MQNVKMSLKKIKRPTVTLNSRKYRFLLSEVVLFTAFWIVYNWVMVLFPVMDTSSPSEILPTADYAIYMVFMLISLFFLAFAVFLLGVWYQQWRTEKGEYLCIIP